MAFSATVLNELADFGQKVSDPLLVVDVINIFLNEGQEQAKQISKAVHKENIKKLAHEIHKLKSSSATVGANSLVETCIYIESIMKEPNNTVGSELDRLLSELQKECAKLRCELKDFLAARG